MEKIVPFKKDIIFNTNVAEITSISLEHTLHVANDNLINGCFTVSGDYKMSDTSLNTEYFKYDLPFDINMDERYILDNVDVDIDDFYYEIINNNILSVNIDVKIDKLNERLIPKEITKEEMIEENNLETTNEVRDVTFEKFVDDKRCIEKEEIIEKDEKPIELKKQYEEIGPVIREDIINPTEEIKSLFDSIDNTSETYTTYRVCIVRQGDTLESIMLKYNITKETLEIYNDLKEIKLGDKIIIPTSNA